jgi:hypothetical protein
MRHLGLPKADRPKEVGLLPERLQRISAAFRDDVDRGMIPGAVLLIACGGQVGYAEAFGWRDREKQAPMLTYAEFGDTPVQMIWRDSEGRQLVKRRGAAGDRACRGCRRRAD